MVTILHKELNMREIKNDRLISPLSHMYYSRGYYKNEWKGL